MTRTMGQRFPTVSRIGGGPILAAAAVLDALAATLAMPTAATAAPNCMARILADVPAEEAPEQTKSKANGTFGPIVQVKVNKKTGKMVYCAKGSYCYNSNAFEINTPCRLKLDKGANAGDYFSYFTR